MSRTFRTARQADGRHIPDGRMVKEFTLCRLAKAFRRFMHHRERRQTVREIREEVAL